MTFKFLRCNGKEPISNKGLKELSILLLESTFSVEFIDELRSREEPSLEIKVGLMFSFQIHRT